MTEQARDEFQLSALEVITRFATDVYGSTTRRNVVKAYRALVEDHYGKARKFYSEYFEE